MRAAVTTERMAESSPRSTARAASVTYWLYFLALALGGLFSAGLVVPGDASATATNILAHEPAFRLGFAFDLISIVFYLATTVLVYALFRPVNRSLSLLAVCCNLVGSAIHGVRAVFQLAVLLVLGGGHDSGAFTLDQRQGLALMLLTMQEQAWEIALVFFGVFWLLIGYLIFKVTFLPRLLGVLAVVSGLSWLTFLSPPLADALSPGIRVLGVLGEFALMGWLLVRGVNVQRWNEQASAAGAPLRAILS
jgi:hypothetical protein